MDNIDALDGLRGLAVTEVVALHMLQANTHVGFAVIDATQHAWEVLRSGVELFFVLSGFLLFLPFAKAAVSGGYPPSVRKYFRRRALRIAPAYLAALVLFIVLINPAIEAHEPGLLDVILHVFFLHSLLQSTNASINAPFWTMAVEVQFYVVLPVLAWWLRAALTRRSARTAVVVTGGVLVAAMSGYAFSLVTHGWLHALHRFVTAPSLFQYLPVFGGGMAVAAAYAMALDSEAFATRLRPLARIAGILGVAGVGATVIANYLLFGTWRYGYILTRHLSGASYAAILLAVLMGWHRVPRLLAMPALRLIGLLSYSVYIWNLVILDHLAPHLREWAHGELLTTALLMMVVGVPAVIGVSSISYLAFERPFIAKRASLRQTDAVALQTQAGS